MEVKIKVYTSSSFIDEFMDDWKKLLSAERWAIFSNPDWYKCFLETFYQKAHLQFFVAYVDDRVVGIIPLATQRMNKFGLFLPMTEVLSGRRADFWCPVVKEGFDAIALPALLESILTTGIASGTLVLPHIPTTYASYTTAKKLLDARRIPYAERQTVCPWLTFESTYEETEKKWSKNHRYNIRRRKRQLEETFGPLSLQVIEAKDEALRHLPDFFEMHNRQWLSRRMPATFTDPMNQKLFYAFIEHLWDVGVHFSILRCGERTIAYHFGFVCNGFLLWYKPAFHIDLSLYSPGKVHISMLIENGIKKGLRGLDFLQGAESYKSLWADKIETTGTFIINTRKYSPGYFWLVTGRPFMENKVGNIYKKTQVLVQKIKEAN